jgi:hypothetical protein
MANIKLTTSNYDNKLADWENNIGTTRADILYFLTSEINETDIQQVAWKKNVLISITRVDNFTSKITFLDTLN